MAINVRRTKDLSVEHRAMLDRAAMMPTAGRLAEGGVLDFVAGRPEHPDRPDDARDDQNFNEDGSRKNQHERKPRYDVELLCRTFVGDAGHRPLNNIMFWESPDIWVEGPSGDPDLPTPGVVNQVKVHIWNLGLADCWSAQVDLYWCNSAVGINAASANPIGSKTVPLGGGQHTVLSFDWVPEILNQGHACLFAQVFDPLTDPLVAPFNPVQDRHVGQRNLSVMQVPAGESMNLKLLSQNLSWTAATTLLEVQMLEGDALELVGMALGQRKLDGAKIEELELSPSEVILIDLPPHARSLMTGAFRETLQHNPRQSEVRRVGGRLRALAAGGRLISEVESKRDPNVQPEEVANQFDRSDLVMRLLPGQQVSLSFKGKMPEGARTGSSRVYRIVERTADQITGGMTIVLQAV